MARPRLYGQDVRTKIRELYSSGMTPNRVAYVVGINSMTVRRELQLPPYHKPKDALYLMTAGYTDKQ